MTKSIHDDPILQDLVKKAVTDCMAQIDKTLSLVDVVSDDPDMTNQMKGSILLSLASNFTNMALIWISMDRDIDVTQLSPMEYNDALRAMMTGMGKSLLDQHKRHYKQDDVASALSLPTFIEQHEALHRLVKENDRLVEDPRLVPWYREHKAEIIELVMKKLGIQKDG